MTKKRANIALTRFYANYNKCLADFTSYPYMRLPGSQEIQAARRPENPYTMKDPGDTNTSPMRYTQNELAALRVSSQRTQPTIDEYENTYKPLAKQQLAQNNPLLNLDENENLVDEKALALHKEFKSDLKARHKKSDILRATRISEGRDRSWGLNSPRHRETFDSAIETMRDPANREVKNAIGRTSRLQKQLDQTPPEDIATRQALSRAIDEQTAIIRNNPDKFEQLSKARGDISLLKASASPVEYRVPGLKHETDTPYSYDNRGLKTSPGEPRLPIGRNKLPDGTVSYRAKHTNLEAESEKLGKTYGVARKAAFPEQTQALPASSRPPLAMNAELVNTTSNSLPEGTRPPINVEAKVADTVENMAPTIPRANKAMTTQIIREKMPQEQTIRVKGAGGANNFLVPGLMLGTGAAILGGQLLYNKYQEDQRQKEFERQKAIYEKYL